MLGGHQADRGTETQRQQSILGMTVSIIHKPSQGHLVCPQHADSLFSLEGALCSSVPIAQSRSYCYAEGTATSDFT